MNDTYVALSDIRRIERGMEASALATAMYDRILAELRRLSPGEWNAVTVCDPWTVTDVVRHLVGAAKGHASMREFVRQAIHGARHRAEFDGNDMDAMNALQVNDHAHLDPDGLLAELGSIAPRAVAKRMSRPRLMRSIRVPNAPGGSTADGMPESLRLGHLLDAILTRDVFLHRLDVARAVDRPVEVDETEARLIADVVAEWGTRHGSPFRLALSGPAGGRYAAGEAGPELEIDALEFCWILSGRAPAFHPLLTTRVLF